MRRRLIDRLRSEAPAVERVEEVDVNHLHAFRAYMATRPRRDGRLLQAGTLHASHRAIHTFIAWAELGGYPVDGRMLRLPPPRRPHKEATVHHMTQPRAILAACRRPEETMAVRILVCSGVRISELSRLAMRGPDGLPDVLLAISAARPSGCHKVQPLFHKRHATDGAQELYPSVGFSRRPKGSAHTSIRNADRCFLGGWGFSV